MNDAEMFSPTQFLRVERFQRLIQIKTHTRRADRADHAEEVLLRFTAETNPSTMMSSLVLTQASCLHLSCQRFPDLHAILFYDILF